MIYIVLLFFLILCWTINPFLKKIMMNKFNALEFFLFNNIFIMLFLILYLFGLKLVNNKSTSIEIKKIYELTTKEYITLIGGALLSVVGALLFLYLIKMDDITKLVSLSQSLTIILSIIIGYTFFSESMKTKDILGILLIVAGITVLKYKAQ